MNQLISTSNQTPIEIALQIDDNGMTTAKRLYEFLQLEKKNYSRWSKSNILENEFAEENTDYFPFVINEECGGQATTDYKLTAAFAKKLSMTAKSENGEEARDYFVKTEDKLKDLAIRISELPPEMQMFKTIFDQQAKQYIEMQQLKQDSHKVQQRVESIREVISLDTTSWREETGNLLRKIGIELGGGQAFSQVRSESYELLNKRFGVDLKTRHTNKRRRMAEEGASKSKRDNLSYLDIIADDKKLIEGYTAIVKDMAIKYGVV